MEWLGFMVCIAIFSASAIILLRRRNLSRHKQLPPGPPGWPIFGNMFDLGTMPHRTLTDLRNKYGDVVWLRFGSVNTMTILSGKAATDFFKNHDLSFAERKISEIMRACDYYKSSLALAPYGSFWRVLRRLVTVDMLVTKRVMETAPLRKKCVHNMITWIEQEARGPQGEARGIHVARSVFLPTFNLLGNLMMSRDLVDRESKVGSEFFEVMIRLMEWSGQPNMADFFPILRRLDPQGLRRKMERDVGIVLGIASKFVKERIEEKKNNNSDENRKDFLDVLLEYEGNGNDEPAKFSDKDLHFFIMEIFLAGSETTSSTMEWAMTELLRHPESMDKAKAELAQVVGSNRTLEEDDIDKLPYLKAVIKEIFRLHPPIPLLIPRQAMEDTKFQGYDIPKGTQVFINAWAIGRDPEVWDDPLSFKPERFLDSKVDYKGQHYELIPFGAGRRMCAGVPLAHRMLHLILGSLLHQFDWELDGSVSKEKMDMSDKIGVTMRKAEPLIAVPKRCSK